MFLKFSQYLQENKPQASIFVKKRLFSSKYCRIFKSFFIDNLCWLLLDVFSLSDKGQLETRGIFRAVPCIYSGNLQNRYILKSSGFELKYRHFENMMHFSFFTILFFPPTQKITIPKKISVS